MMNAATGRRGALTKKPHLLRSRGIEQQAAQQMISTPARRRAAPSHPQRRSESRCWRVLDSVCREALYDISVEQVRDFPVLNREVNGRAAGLSRQASAQKPEDRRRSGISIATRLRGGAPRHHTLSAEATARMEAVRQQAATSLTPDRREEARCSSAAPPRVSTWWPTAGERQRRRRG